MSGIAGDGGDQSAFELDPTTNVGMVRLLITDVNEADPLFTDTEIEAFLTLESGVKRAAASALETIARSELLISKKITTQDLSTDGPAVAAELRATAKALREQAAKDRSDDGLDPSQALLPRYSFPAPVSWGDSYL
ncbi:hypothetical protein [Micromonospora sp. NPDC050695]|uniref:hypothetical protein n=1 Tax=Micromonospora sp. NPDC050695 TaxID=3154938 RepID=UPI0033C87128